MFAADISAPRLADMRIPRIVPIALLAGILLLISGSVFIRDLNHDEGQYVAAVAAMRRGWPYLDFPYLQTPLQPLLFSPLSLFPAGWLYLSVRVVNAALGLATLLFVATALRTRASQTVAMVAVGALACTDIFLFASAEARNDALPMALLAAAIAMHLRALQRGRTVVALAGAGLLYGLAASAKISFAIPAAGAALFMVARAWRTERRAAIVFVLGNAAGLLPALVLALLAPNQFLFDVFTYNLQAPQQYWRAIGEGYRLGPWNKIRELLVLALPSPMIAAFAVAVFDRRRSAPLVLLDILIGAALVSAYLPDPSFAQYWVPVLPPLFIRLGMSLDYLPHRRRTAVAWLVGAGCVAGLIPTAILAQRAFSGKPGITAAIADGRCIARLAQGSRVVSLAPQLIAGADTNFDERFVTGPFLFRTFGPLSGKALALGLSPNWQRLADSLDAEPPALIVVGTEGKARPPVYPHGLDGPLIAWAEAHHYRSSWSPSRQLLLFTQPSRPPR